MTDQERIDRLEAACKQVRDILVNNFGCSGYECLVCDMTSILEGVLEEDEEDDE